ncbi:MAG: cupin-like domain-containing protein [Wenzhouxiangellaceae bacterium]|nr:cupin-like domain-containing protein [Wenzhouxiangellaceae bacterium]
MSSPSPSPSPQLARPASAEHALLRPGLPRLALAHDGIDALNAALRDSQAAIIDDFAAGWPALSQWTPEALARRYGERIVRVFDASFGQPGRGYMGNVDAMPFAEFLDTVLTQGRDLRMFLYNIARQIPALVDDIRPPAIGHKFSRRFVFTFFGCKGSTTPLHYDIDMGCVFHTVIRGRRRVRLFAPDQSARLYRHPCTVRSYVDLDRPDFMQFPALADARGHEVVLEPGQTLMMPPGWWHEFHYLEAGIGVSLRSPPMHLSDRLHGARNVLLASPFDRLANKLAAQSWYRWKQRRAERNARAACVEQSEHAPNKARIKRRVR